MRKGILSQEMLKAIACITMLIDHIGAILMPGNLWLRIIGRIAFPIFAFLLAEGAHHTKNPLKYAARLFIGMLLSELPFDFAIYGGFTWAHQSVMVTLFLAFLMAVCIKDRPMWAKLLLAVPFVILADLLGTDYGGFGILTVLIFLLTRDAPEKLTLQALGLGLVFLLMNSTIQIFALLALLLIALYSGRKSTGNKALQWGFYLFYPAHLAILWLMSLL